jgi:hypothetical protein
LEILRYLILLILEEIWMKQPTSFS